MVTMTTSHYQFFNI